MAILPAERPVTPLRQRMLDDMAMRSMRLRTQHDYVRHVRAFAAFLGRSPDTATAEDVRRFQLHQREHGVGESVIGATVSALRFLFGVTLDRPDLSRRLVLAPRPRKLPDVLSIDEVGRLLEAAPGNKFRAALGVAYGAGLRVSEVAHLKADDIDSKRMLRASLIYEHNAAPISRHLERDDVTELVINQPGTIGLETRNGWEWHEEPALDNAALMTLAKLIAGLTKQDINSEYPICSSVLPGGERAQVIVPPAVEQGFISITVRKASGVTMDIDDFDRAGLFSEVRARGLHEEVDAKLESLRQAGEWKSFFRLAVEARKNILISGATGSGKTSFSKGLIKLIPEYERILTIEDTRELVVPQRNRVHMMYAKDGKGLQKAGAKELLESALRMRPDRILLQELRDGIAFFYLRNVNSGHPGSITTVHTPWRKVPAALWALKAYPIVYKPFVFGISIGLVLTIVIVVSTLFSRQKLHGEARWARVGEIRKGLMLAPSGIVLGKFGGKVMRFGGPEHVLLEAPTRAGKGVGVIIPNLLEWLDSLVVLDIKQENYDNTAGYRLKVLGQQVLLFNPLDPKGRTVRYNPLSYINRRDPVEVINELQKIGVMLFPDPLSGESFWAESARTAFLGVAAYVAATVDDGNDALPFTIGEIYRQFAAGDAAKRFPKIISKREQAGKPLSGGCVSALRDFVTASPNTFTSIRQSVTAKINAWLNPYVDAATSESDFDLSEFRDRRISLYLGVSPDDLERVAPIYGLLFQQLIDRNVRELPKGDRHQVKVLVALDEFASLGKCSVLANAFSYVAGYGLRLLPAFQSMEQIQGVYGDKVAADIERNCAVRLVLRPAGLPDAKKISEQLGAYTFKARSRSMGTWGGGGGSTSESDQRRPLLLPQEVEMLPENDLIVFRRGMWATYGKKVRYYAEKKLAARTKIPAPEMPTIRVDPTVAHNSLRVIAAAEAEGTIGGAPDRPPPASSHGTAEPTGAVGSATRRLNRAAIEAAKAAPPGERTAKLFEHVVAIAEAA